MRDGRSRTTWAAAITMVLATLGAALAQDPPARPAPRGKVAAKKPGIRAGGGAPPKKGVGRDADDPLAKGEPEWPFHYRLKIAGGDGNPLAATYYPSKLGASAPVVLLVHETGVGRSSKDFQEPIDDLGGLGFAAHLQEQDYAVFLLDLRGHGANPRRTVEGREWRSTVADLQAAYLFLVDRHNRRELNLAKLAVVALGDASNLVASWAAGGGAVSSEGRTSDLAALALVSPPADAQGLRLAPLVAALAPRVPMILIAGTRGAESVKALQDLVERQRRSQVLLVESPLQGQRLLNFFPEVAGEIVKFLDDPVKARNLDWEPRYLLTPIAFTDVKLITQDQKAPPEPVDTPAPKVKSKRETAPAKKAAPTRKAVEPKG